MGIKIESVNTDKFEMEYFRFGSGEKIFVILPGLSIKSVMDAAEDVTKAYEVIAKDYTAYLFDRRRNVPDIYTIEDMANDTAEAMKTLGLKDVYLFGASQGGMIALSMAIEYPELVKKMVLGSTSAHVPEGRYEVVEKWIELAEAKDRVGLYIQFGKEIYPPEVFEQYRDALYLSERA